MSRKNSSVSAGTALQYGTHNMSFEHLTSLDFGRIQPLCVQDCVPNDQIKLNLETVVTSAPNPAPIQGKVTMNVAAFYVPNRVILKDFNKYITGQQQLTIPSFNAATVSENLRRETSYLNDIYAFHGGMGFDINLLNLKNSATTSGFKFSILPYRAYTRCWWDWFRDSNVIPDSNISSYIYDSSVSENFLSVYSRPKYACWPKDYITNTLKSPNGDSSTTVGFTSAYTNYIGGTVFDSGGSDIKTAPKSVISFDGSPVISSTGQPSLNSYNSSSNASTINSIRVANSIQKYLEACNVLGGRVRDRLKGMFGSSVQPETLQMSEFLGRNSFDINFETQSNDSVTNRSNQALDWNAFGTTNPRFATVSGQLTGKSTMTSNGLNNINYHVKEHGYFIVLAWILPNVMCTQGIPNHWLRGVDGVNPSRFDFLDPNFVNNGFEPLYMYEVTNLPKDCPVDDFGTYNPFLSLGYRGKYESYKYNKDIVSGCFVDPSTKVSMRNWWLERDFLRECGVVDATGSWITGKTGTDVVNGVTHNTLSAISSSTKQAYDDKFTITDSDLDHFICQCHVGLEMIRPIPSINLPKIDTVSSTPTEFGGTRL